MTMEVKLKKTGIPYKTQIQVTYTERGNVVQITYYTPLNHTHMKFIYVDHWRLRSVRRARRPSLVWRWAAGLDDREKPNTWFECNLYLRHSFHCTKFYTNRHWVWGNAHAHTVTDETTRSTCKSLYSDALVPTSSSIIGKFWWPSSLDDDDEMFTWTSENGLSRPIATISVDLDSAAGARSRRDLSGDVDLPSSSLVYDCKGLEATSIIGLEACITSSSFQYGSKMGMDEDSSPTGYLFSLQHTG